MADALALWVGRDESEGIPVQPRKDVAPPPHWRLEAIAATERPRSLTLSADRRHAVFIQDGETSDVWLLDLGELQPVPQRLTTGRALMPYWEDTEPRLSPDGAQVAYADDGYVCLAPVAGGPPRRLLEAAGPVWIDDATLLVSMERGDTSRLAVVDVADPWPRRLAVDLRARRRVGAGAYRPIAPRSPSSSRRAPTSTAPRSASSRSPPARCERSPARRGCRTARPRGRPTERCSRTCPSARARGRCTSSAATGPASGS